MGTVLNQIKKQASCFLQEKYKIARLALSDVSEAELLAEEVTSDDIWGPDAKTMTKIAKASCELEDFWRIVDVLHRRFYSIDWKQWRRSYKSLVLIEFLLTHGPEDFADEFQCDTAIIQELGTFKHTDERGINWGANMQRRSENVLKLLGGGKTLKQARLKALRITNEIQGFGSDSLASPASSSTPSPSSSEASASSFGSLSHTTTDSIWNDVNELNKYDQLSPSKELITSYSQGRIKEDMPWTYKRNDLEGLHLWDSPRSEEAGDLIGAEDDEIGESNGLFSGIYSKLAGISPKSFNGHKVPFRSFSYNSGEAKKKYGSQYSLGH